MLCSINIDNVLYTHFSSSVNTIIHNIDKHLTSHTGSIVSIQVITGRSDFDTVLRGLCDVCAPRMEQHIMENCDSQDELVGIVRQCELTK